MDKLPSKPWWESTAIQGNAVNALTLLFAIMKIGATGEDAAAIVVAVFGLIGVTSSVVGRARAKTSLRLTK